jgi:hypothetical protein
LVKNNYHKVFGTVNDKTKNHDVDEDKIFIKLIDAAAKFGALSISSDKQGFIYTPNSDSLSQEVITYTFSDYNSTASSKLTINVKNTKPVANVDLFTGIHTVVHVIDLLGNDIDENGDSLIIVKASITKKGRVVISADKKTVKYVPEVLGPYTYSFQYTISDGTEEANSYAIVKLVNTAPTATDNTITVAKNSKKNVIPLWYSDTDSLSVMIVKVDTRPRGSVEMKETTTAIRKTMYP